MTVLVCGVTLWGEEGEQKDGVAMGTKGNRVGMRQAELPRDFSEALCSQCCFDPEVSGIKISPKCLEVPRKHPSEGRRQGGCQTLKQFLETVCQIWLLSLSLLGEVLSLKSGCCLPQLRQEGSRMLPLCAALSKGLCLLACRWGSWMWTCAAPAYPACSGCRTTPCTSVTAAGCPSLWTKARASCSCPSGSCWRSRMKPWCGEDPRKTVQLGCGVSCSWNLL